MTLAAMERLNMRPSECSTAVQGFGNVGSVAANLLTQQGCKVVAVSDISGGYYNSAGLDIQAMIDYSREHEDSLEGYSEAESISNDELLTLDVDVLAPCAKEDQITKRNAGDIKAKIISEGANGPTSPRADAILRDNGCTVIPDILANAGGVTVSYFEWVQDRQGYFWTLERVNRRLDRMMHKAFDDVFDKAEEHDVTLRIGAYVLAIKKVADALELRGIYA